MLFGIKIIVVTLLSMDDFLVLSCFFIILNLYNTLTQLKMNLLIIIIIDGLNENE